MVTRRLHNVIVSTKHITIELDELINGDQGISMIIPEFLQIHATKLEFLDVPETNFNKNFMNATIVYTYICIYVEQKKVETG